MREDVQIDAYILACIHAHECTHYCLHNDSGVLRAHTWWLVRARTWAFAHVGK